MTFFNTFLSKLFMCPKFPENLQKSRPNCHTIILVSKTLTKLSKKLIFRGFVPEQSYRKFLLNQTVCLVESLVNQIYWLTRKFDILGYFWDLYQTCLFNQVARVFGGYFSTKANFWWTKHWTRVNLIRETRFFCFWVDYSIRSVFRLGKAIFL